MHNYKSAQNTLFFGHFFLKSSFVTFLRAFLNAVVFGRFFLKSASNERQCLSD